MGFIAGLIIGIALTSCVASDKINDLNLEIANLQYKLQRANEK